MIRLVADIIIELGIAGLVASVMLAILASIINQYPVILIASPVLLGFLPMMVGFGTATGLLPAGAGNLVTFREGRKSSTQSSSSQGSEVVAGGVAGGIAGATITQTVGETKLREEYSTEALR